MSDVRGERNQTKWCPKRNATLLPLPLSHLSSPCAHSSFRHRSCPLLLLTLFPIAENVYDAPLEFRPKNPMDVPPRACNLDKMLRAFTYITSNVERPDIYRDKMNKISITKVAYVIYVASCFWSRVKSRGHCIRYRDIYSRFPLLRIDISARSEERFRIKKKYAVPKRRRRWYTDYFIIIINFCSDDLNFC